MKSFSTVYKTEKKQALLEKASIYNLQKIEVINALKHHYMIEGQISDLPSHKQAHLKKQLLEYWSPKTGINAKGIAFINDGNVSLSKSSTANDVTRFIINETKRNKADVIKAFKMNESDVIIGAFKDTIEPMIEKRISEKSIRDIVWNVISESIKEGF